MTAQPPRLFDRALHRRRLDRAATGFSAAGFLKERAAVDAVERLEAIMRSFPLAVDLGNISWVDRQDPIGIHPAQPIKPSTQRGCRKRVGPLARGNALGDLTDGDGTEEQSCRVDHV